MEHFEAKFREKQDECSQHQAHVIKLKTALETETEEHARAKQYVRKLVKQLQSAKEYMIGLEAQEERTVDLINTICTSPRPFYQIPSTATLVS